MLLLPFSNELIFRSPRAGTYFSYYVLDALFNRGYGAEALARIRKQWGAMLDDGRTTCMEQWDITKGYWSVCHAWSAHPNFDLLTLVAGIRPASPGFRTVLVEPHLAGLSVLNARMPHPDGEIVASYRKTDAGWAFDIILPPGVAGSLRWGGRTAALAAGPNHVDFRR